MIAQKARKPEYRRENFAVLRRKRGGEWIVRSYRYNALGMLHAKEATGSNTRTTLEELIAGKEAADDPDGDADKSRITTYVYDLTQPYYEVLTESTNGKVTSYTYGLERLAAYTEQAQTKYLYDGRGSVIQTIQVNTENSILGEADRFVKAYSPYGELLSEKVSGYGFNGEYFDAATGMLNLRARQYEPAQGRFSQKDSEKGHVANARSLNAYLGIEIPYLCINDAGQMLTPNLCSHHFQQAAKKVGLKGMRLHDLRHTVVTYMLDAGENPKTVQEFVGHADPGFMLRQYAHVLEQSKKRASDTLMRTLFGQKV